MPGSVGVEDDELRVEPLHRVPRTGARVCVAHDDDLGPPGEPLLGDGHEGLARVDEDGAERCVAHE
jgi:hypothetical protein